MKIHRICAVLILAMSCLPLQAQMAAVDEADYQQKLEAGWSKLQARRPVQAIADYFDVVITGYEKQFVNLNQVVFSTRGASETMFYQLLAANLKKELVLLGPTWAEAQYLKSRALSDLMRFDEARKSILRAIELAPSNSLYQSELCQMESYERKWGLALVCFERAASLAEEYAPQKTKLMELGRAWRGIAYVYMQQGELTPARNAYEKCLRLTPQDQIARQELDYILSGRLSHESNEI